MEVVPASSAMMYDIGSFLLFLLLVSGSERQRGADLVPPLGLDDALPVRHDARRTEGGKNGLQGQRGGVVLLREVAERELLAAPLNEFQQLHE